MDPAVYQLFAWACPAVLLWLMAFIALTVALLIRRAGRGQTDVHRDSLIGGELPGLPLVLLHSVAFVASLMQGDWLSAVIFAWWGPGFVIVAVLILSRRRLHWRPVATLVSWACKGNYLALVGLFAWHGLWPPIFAYSLWIMHDQVRLAWLQGNADRTRRTSEDYWLPRLGYPLGLGIPAFVPDFPLRWWCLAFGVLILALWLWGIARLVRSGGFFRKPVSFTDNLRDIVYLRRPSA